MLTNICKRNFAKAMPAFSHTPQKYTGPSYKEMWDIRQKHCSTAMTPFYQDEAVLIVEGKKQYVYD